MTSTDRAARILVAYYSATGHVHALAEAVAEGTARDGAWHGWRRSSGSRGSTIFSTCEPGLPALQESEL